MTNWFSCQDNFQTVLIPRTSLKFGERAYSITGPAAWNSLPVDIQTTSSSQRKPRLLRLCLHLYNVFKCFSCCSNDVVQLKEKQVDYITQHHIAVDLFHEIRTRFTFTYHPPCILDAVQLVALTISNLQHVQVLLSQTEGINKDDVEQFHKTVEGHVYDLLMQVKIWLQTVLPVKLDTTDKMELFVSMLVPLYHAFYFYASFSSFNFDHGVEICLLLHIVIYFRQNTFQCLRWIGESLFLFVLLAVNTVGSFELKPFLMSCFNLCVLSVRE